MKRKLNIDTANVQNEHELKNKTGGCCETQCITYEHVHKKIQKKTPKKSCKVKLKLSTNYKTFQEL